MAILPVAAGFKAAATAGFAGLVVGGVQGVATIAINKFVASQQKYQIRHAVNLTGNVITLGLGGASVFLYTLALANSPLIATAVTALIMGAYLYQIVESAELYDKNYAL